MSKPRPFIPFEVNMDEWMTARQAAISFRKSVPTIRRWCEDGTFEEFGIEVAKDLGGVWMIRVNAPREKKTITHRTLKALKTALA